VEDSQDYWTGALIDACSRVGFVGKLERTSKCLEGRGKKGGETAIGMRLRSKKMIETTEKEWKNRVACTSKLGQCSGSDGDGLHRRSLA
jgi:hypothetical protein